MARDVPRYLDELGVDYEVRASGYRMFSASNHEDCGYEATFVIELVGYSVEPEEVIEKIGSHRFASPFEPAHPAESPDVYISHDGRLITIQLESGPWSWSFDLRCW